MIYSIYKSANNLERNTYVLNLGIRIDTNFNYIISDIIYDLFNRMKRNLRGRGS